MVQQSHGRLSKFNAVPRRQGAQRKRARTRRGKTNSTVGPICTPNAALVHLALPAGIIGSVRGGEFPAPGNSSDQADPNREVLISIIRRREPLTSGKRPADFAFCRPLPDCRLLRFLPEVRETRLKHQPRGHRETPHAAFVADRHTLSQSPQRETSIRQSLQRWRGIDVSVCVHTLPGH